MNIYLLSQTDNDGYDTYDSMVVAAKDENSARRICPSSYLEWSDKKDSWIWSHDKTVLGLSNSWADHIDNIEVKLIGVAEPQIKEGIICSSFNAG